MYFYINFWVKNKDAILFTNHFDLGWKENSLKIDWDPVELSGKTALISTKPRLPPKTIMSFELIILLESRRLNAKQKYFLSISSVKCSGAFCGFGSQLALLWPLNLAFAYLLLVRDTYYTTRNTIRDFVDWWFIRVSNTITITVVSFLFYTSYFTGITILSYILASQTQQ